jgi:hypothetical protein
MSLSYPLGPPQGTTGRAANQAEDDTGRDDLCEGNP